MYVPIHVYSYISSTIDEYLISLQKPESLIPFWCFLPFQLCLANQVKIQIFFKKKRDFMLYQSKNPSIFDTRWKMKIGIAKVVFYFLKPNIFTLNFFPKWASFSFNYELNFPFTKWTKCHICHFCFFSCLFCLFSAHCHPNYNSHK